MGTPKRRNGVTHGVRTSLGRAAPAIGGLNLALAVGLVIVSFEPLRSQFGRTTGWWHPCVPVGGGVGFERWSPTLLLVAAVPVCLGIMAAVSAPNRRARVMARSGAVALMLVAAVLVFVPFGSCIA